MENIQTQARDLYFQDDLSITQIADALKISRRTMHFWIREHNWDKLKKNAALIPSLLTENVYGIFDRFTQQLLAEDRTEPITCREINSLHRLTISISKLKSRVTLNETMEVLGHFIDRVNDKSPELVDAVVPLVDDFILSRAAVKTKRSAPTAANTTTPIEEPQKPAPTTNKEETPAAAPVTQDTHPQQLRNYMITPVKCKEIYQVNFKSPENTNFLGRRHSPRAYDELISQLRHQDDTIRHLFPGLRNQHATAA